MCRKLRPRSEDSVSLEESAIVTADGQSVAEVDVRVEEIRSRNALRADEGSSQSGGDFVPLRSGGGYQQCDRRNQSGEALSDISPPEY